MEKIKEYLKESVEIWVSVIIILILVIFKKI